MPFSHPSLGCPFFFLSLGTGLARTGTNTGIPGKRIFACGKRSLLNLLRGWSVVLSLICAGRQALHTAHTLRFRNVHSSTGGNSSCELCQTPGSLLYSSSPDACSVRFSTLELRSSTGSWLGGGWYPRGRGEQRLGERREEASRLPEIEPRSSRDRAEIEPGSPA